MLVKDVVCGMALEKEQAFATVDHRSKTYHFCSEQCRQHFVRHPDWYVPADHGSSRRGGERPERTAGRRGWSMSWERWAIGLLGAWTMAMAALVPAHRLVGWSDLATGLAIILAGLSLARSRRIRGVLASFLGLWLAAGTFFVPLHESAGLASNNIIIGLAVFLVGFVPYERPSRQPVRSGARSGSSTSGRDQEE